ncbi:MAG TPA: hypothetical protein ENN41_10235, partial [Sediminispirochaeta sp.]|nr:hypothetical protein [Sediminispirochaeta sp.]
MTGIRGGARKSRHRIYQKFLEEQQERLSRNFPRLLQLWFALWFAALFIEIYRPGRRYGFFTLALLLLLLLAVFLVRKAAPHFFYKNKSRLHGLIVFVLSLHAATSTAGLLWQGGGSQLWYIVLVTFYSVVMFFSFVFAFSLRNLLPLLMGVPLMGVMGSIWFGPDFGGIKMIPLCLSFLIITFVMLSVSSRIADRIYFREFWIRVIAERRGEKLREELQRAEMLNAELQRTRERLEREIGEREETARMLEQFAAF